MDRLPIACRLKPLENLLFRLAVAGFTIALIGIGEEYRQWFDPHHITELLDAIFDMLGIGIGLLPYFIYGTWYRTKSKRQSTVRAWPVAVTFFLIIVPLLYGLKFLDQTPGTTTPNPEQATYDPDTLDVQYINQTAEENDKALETSEKGESRNPQSLSDKNTSADAKAASQATDAPQNTGGAALNGQSTVTPSAAEIIKVHEPQFADLKQQTHDKLKQLVKDAKADLKISNEVQLLALYTKYKARAENLEAETDEQFNVLYADLQKDLVDHGYDSKQADPVKKAFFEKKSATKQIAISDALNFFIEANPALSDLLNN